MAGPYRYAGAIPVKLSDWYSPHHTGMVPTIPVWPPAYLYGEGHTGVAHIIPVYWGPYRLHCLTGMAGLVLPSDKKVKIMIKKISRGSISDHFHLKKIVFSQCSPIVISFRHIFGELAPRGVKMWSPQCAL